MAKGFVNVYFCHGWAAGPQANVCFILPRLNQICIQGQEKNFKKMIQGEILVTKTDSIIFWSKNIGKFLIRYGRGFDINNRGITFI